MTVDFTIFYGDKKPIVSLAVVIMNYNWYVAVGKVKRDKTKNKIYREKLMNWIVAFCEGDIIPQIYTFTIKLKVTVWQPKRCTQRLFCKREPSGRSAISWQPPAAVPLESAAAFLLRPHPPQAVPTKDGAREGPRAGPFCLTRDISDGQQRWI